MAATISEVIVLRNKKRCEDQTFSNWVVVAISPGPIGNFSEALGFSSTTTAGASPFATVSDSLAKERCVHHAAPIQMTKARTINATHMMGMPSDFSGLAEDPDFVERCFGGAGFGAGLG